MDGVALLNLIRNRWPPVLLRTHSHRCSRIWQPYPEREITLALRDLLGAMQ